jgi:CubicO group peptidase (beta-lactamase class C family)
VRRTFRTITWLAPLSIMVGAAPAAFAQVPAGCVAAPAASDAAYRRAIRAAERLICDSLLPRLPGVQVAVAVNGKLVWSEGFGYADLARRAPVTSASQFRIGSVSKPLTASAVALLVEQGTLDLDAPVQRYVPAFPEKPWPITTRELAGHTAGIRHYRGDEFLLNRPFRTVAEGLEIFAGDSLLFEPGTRYSYSSYGWSLISAVVEGASGEDFLSYMSRHVLGPLGLVHTTPDRVDSTLAGRVHFYERDSAGGFRLAPPVDNSYKWAGGGFLSTAEDLVRFGSAFLHPGFVRPETLTLLFTTQHTRDGQATGYGVGWFLATDSLGHRRAFHGGSSVGGSTAFGLDRDSYVVFAITTNFSDAPFGPARRIQDWFDAAAAGR